MKTKVMAVVVAGLLLPAAQGAHVYIISSGNTTIDDAVVQAITAHGHTATVGVTFSQFDGTQNLAGIDTVYFQANVNWGAGAMPAAGQQMLVNWVLSGGRLVTSEWVIWGAGVGYHQTLDQALPVDYVSYGFPSPVTYEQFTADASINAGLSPVFTFPVVSYSGTETRMTARPGATVYYTTQSFVDGVGLAGWQRGSGSVFSFSTTCGPGQLADPDFRRLFANVMGTGASPRCYADCDDSGTLNIIDFLCFIDEFAIAQTLPVSQQIEHYANCNGSTTEPVLSIIDFLCFIDEFAQGCP